MKHKKEQKRREHSPGRENEQTPFPAFELFPSAEGEEQSSEHHQGDHRLEDRLDPLRGEGVQIFHRKRVEERDPAHREEGKILRPGAVGDDHGIGIRIIRVQGFGEQESAAGRDEDEPRQPQEFFLSRQVPFQDADRQQRDRHIKHLHRPVG